MKKYLVIYHSTKKIDCTTILSCVLFLLFVHLTSRLAMTFSCTLYPTFTPLDCKCPPKLMECSLSF